MRKFRILLLAFLILLLAGGYWVWRDRDHMLPLLVNPLMESAGGGSRIAELQGLHWADGRLAFARLRLEMASGAEIRLRDVELLAPGRMLFPKAGQRSRLRILETAYTPGDSSSDGPDGELSLRETAQLLGRYLPESVDIERLAWQGADLFTAGPLQLTLNDATRTLAANLTIGSHALHSRWQLRGETLGFSAQANGATLSLAGELTPAGAGHWQASARVRSDLAGLAQLPLPSRLSQMAASADGQLDADLSVKLPDNILQFEGYRDIALHLKSESIQIPLPPDLLGTEARVSLSSSSPIGVTLASLQPLRPRDLSGAGRIELALANSSKPLLNADFATSGSADAPEVSTSGRVDMEETNALLQLPRWQEAFAPLRLQEAEGELKFRGSARLIPLAQMAGSGDSWLSEIQLSLLPGSRVYARVSEEQQARLASLGWEKGWVKIQLQSPLALRAGPWPGPIRLAGEAVGLSAEDDEGNLSVDTQLNQIDCTVSEKSHCALKAEQVQVKTMGQYELEGALSSELEHSGEAISGDTRFEAGALQLQSRWQHRLDTARGAASFTLAPASFSQENPLSGSVKGLPLDILAGTVSARGRYSWPEADGDRLELQMDKLAAVYNESFASDIDSHFALVRRGNGWVTDAPQAISVGAIDPGLPVEKVRFALSLDAEGDLTLTEIRAELLGGTLESPKLTWNLDGEERRSQVSLNGVSLRQLAREMEAENFSASGILDLQIPLILGADGVTVEEGTVEARPPGGRLRYYGAFSPQMLASNPQLKLIAGALEDYNYRQLSGTLQYPPSGDMQLQLKLVGRSQSVAKDRDLIINLNLENNIPQMLRSLQASRDLTETLEKQMGSD